MKKAISFAIASSLVLGPAVMSVRHDRAHAADGGAQGVASQAQTQAVVAAASAFLGTLGPEQRKAAQLPFTPQKASTLARFRSSDGKGPPEGFVGEQYGKAVWSNYPVSDVPRPGLELGGLNARQRGAAMRLLQAVLSPKGYRKVLDIMGSDQALADSGTPFASGRNAYTIAVFGAPSAAAPWMVQFGGHHLALNVVIAGAHGALTPTLTGAQPSVYRDGAKTVRVLAGENDKAFALMAALDAGQRKQAILNYKVGDLVLGPGHDGETIMPEGLKASTMTAGQKAMLTDLIAEWAGIVNDAYAKPHMDEIKAGLNETYFAWSGPLTHAPGMNGTSYYRIQGPRVLIEFSPQSSNGDPALHVHTIYRDPTNEYGRRYTQP